MKYFFILAVILLAVTGRAVDNPTDCQRFCPVIPSATPIIWKTTLDNLPLETWSYKRRGAKIFSAEIVSNALSMAELQDHALPRSFDKEFSIADTHRRMCPGVSNVIFFVQPAFATLSFGAPEKTNATAIPEDVTIAFTAKGYAAKLGIDLTQTTNAIFTTEFDSDADGNLKTNRIAGRRIFYARVIDGLPFYSAYGNGESSEGFVLNLGAGGQIRSCSVNWPDLIRDVKGKIASQTEIVDFMRARKGVVLPEANEEKYFERLKMLSGAKSFAITTVTAYYADGPFEKVPEGNEPPPLEIPIIEINMVATLEHSKSDFRMIMPLLSRDFIEANN